MFGQYVICGWCSIYNHLIVIRAIKIRNLGHIRRLFIWVVPIQSRTRLILPKNMGTLICNLILLRANFGNDLSYKCFLIDKSGIVALFCIVFWIETDYCFSYSSRVETLFWIIPKKLNHFL